MFTYIASSYILSGAIAGLLIWVLIFLAGSLVYALSHATKTIRLEFQITNPLWFILIGAVIGGILK